MTVATYLQKLWPSDYDPNGGEGFGAAIAIDGDIAVIGCPSKKDVTLATTPGAAYVFTYASGAWTQLQRLDPDETTSGMEFGRSVAICGEYIIIGCPVQQVTGTACGTAYVYHWNGSSYALEQKLSPADAAAGQRFGDAVSIASSTCAVGSPSDDRPCMNNGAVYLFTRSGVTWTETAKLATPDVHLKARLGTCLSLSDEELLAGAPSDNEDYPGALYTYQSRETGWLYWQQVPCRPYDIYAGFPWCHEYWWYDIEDGNEFGTAIAEDSGFVAVGAPHKTGVEYFYDTPGTHSGAVSILRKLNTSYWRVSTTILPPDASTVDDGNYGASVALSNGWLAAGAPGAAAVILHCYAVARDSWDLEETVSEGLEAADLYGCAVALDTDRGHLLVGASADDIPGASAEGSVYVYTAVVASASTHIPICALYTDDVREGA